jgi:hypothetical protein
MEKLVNYYLTIGDKSKTNLENIIKSISNWIISKDDNNISKEEISKINQSENIHIQKKEASIERIFFEDELFRFCGYRYEDKTKPIYGKWTTEIIIKEDKCNLIQNLNVNIGFKSKNHNGKKINVAIPNFLFDIHNKFQLYSGNHPFCTKAKQIDVDNPNILRYLIHGKDNLRNHPLILISKTNEGKFLVDYNKIALGTFGLALTYYLDIDKDTSFMLMRDYSKEMKCYNGTIKIYWPNPEESYNEYWLPNKIIDMQNSFYSVEEEIINFIKKASVRKISEEELTFSSLKNKYYKIKIKKQKDRSESLEALYEDIISENELEIKNLKEENETIKKEYMLSENMNELLKEDLESKIKEIKHVREELINSNEKIKMLEERDIPELEIIKKIPFESVLNVITYYEKNHSEKIIFDNKVYRTLKKNEFKYTTQAALAFYWLINDYKPYVEENQEVINIIKLNEECKNISGFLLSLKQSELTCKNKKYRNDYHMMYEGKEYLCEKHLKYGISFDPKRTLRICFEYVNPKIIVSYVGIHPMNKTTK